ncbi:hypothetical protein EST38_g2619 [Candolleomyces aberdarensis]|uniref:Uncharacterized protein n=1 Tax=Candolleomyces aberdarensis TaxID=2316362 RepID=A0A4Q2DVI4_9AGAR|nr:hypothetical protein EST38_g2619 [Candolleomyces aberdarensis]
MKAPGAVVPIVYAVGGSELIPPPPSFDTFKPQNLDYQSLYLYHEGYSPLYVTSAIPQETDLVASVPVASITGSILSSFTASFKDRIRGFAEPSPLSEATGREKSLFEGFLDRLILCTATMMEERRDQPSFVNDVWQDFFKGTTSRKEETKEDGVDVSIFSRARDEGLPVSFVGLEKEEAPASIVETVTEGIPATIVQETAKEEIPAIVVEEIVTEEVPATVVEEAVTEDVVAPVPAKEKEEEPFTAPVLSAGFISEVTVPDGDVFQPGVKFMKCWRMVNNAGLVAEGNEAVKIGSAKPGQVVDVWTGELKAYEVAGRYVGYWRSSRPSFIQAMSGSSIVMMLTGGLGGTAPASVATSRQPESLTLAIPSSNGLSSVDGDSDPLQILNAPNVAKISFSENEGIPKLIQLAHISLKSLVNAIVQVEPRLHSSTHNLFSEPLAKELSIASTIRPPDQPEQSEHVRPNEHQSFGLSSLFDSIFGKGSNGVSG